MNVRTIVIVSIIGFVILYFLDKKYYRIESVCFEDEDVSFVKIRKGIFSPIKIGLAVGDSKAGCSLKSTGDTITLVLANGRKKVLKKINYYVTNGLDPAA